MSELKTYFLGKNNGREFPVYLKSEADNVIAHHKYKRCLAMVRLCESNVIWVEGCSEWRRWKKWHKRWLKLADKFKEVK